MHPSAAAVLLATVLTMTACSGDAEQPDAGPSLPPVDVCEQVGAEEVPAECIPDADATRLRPTGPPPSGGSAAYSPLRLEPLPGELARADNNEDASRTTATLQVTVPKGARLGIVGACEGRTTFVVTTEPQSKAAFEFDCGFEGAATELGVEDPDPAAQDTRYTVVITVPAPARWAAVAYATTEPVANPVG